MTKQDLNVLRDKLPRGYMKKIKEKTKFSEATIWKVLAGDFYNQTIIDCAIEMATAHQAALKEQTKNINAL